MEPATGPGRCPFCSARWAGELNCPRCAALQNLEAVHSAFEMQGSARALVHGLKYEGIRSAAETMANLLRPVLEPIEVHGAYPVPLHPSRQRQRGFNQAEELMHHLGARPGPGRLQRIRRTATQVGLHLGERRENVAGAFAYQGPSLAGLTLAVLDDVVTTGATANECASVLRDAGARRVYALSFARASYTPGSATPPPD
jgi:ComF family protein